MKIALLKILRNFEQQWENDISDEVIKNSVGIYTKLVGFIRAMCPCAVHDNLFWLIFTTQARSLRAPCQSQLRSSSLHEDFFLF
jgi:hypothetical protein